MIASDCEILCPLEDFLDSAMDMIVTDFKHDCDYMEPYNNFTMQLLGTNPPVPPLISPNNSGSNAPYLSGTDQPGKSYEHLITTH